MQMKYGNKWYYTAPTVLYILTNKAPVLVGHVCGVDNGKHATLEMLHSGTTHNLLY